METVEVKEEKADISDRGSFKEGPAMRILHNCSS